MKHLREPSIEYEVKEDYVVLNYDGKQYAWVPPMKVILKAFLNEDTYDYSIVHNSNGQAMFNVENMRNNQFIFRQEVNPLKNKDDKGWVKDK